MMTSKQMAVMTAHQWLTGNCLILDTETTGLDSESEIVEIAIINCRGEVLLNSLVKPVNAIPAEATAIHGITNSMVENAPAWEQLHNQALDLILDEGFIAYNSEYDARLIRQSAAISGLNLSGDQVALESCHDCAMLLYAEYFGQWDEKRNNFKWQRLTAAAEQQGVKVTGSPHRALADCLLTLGVIKAIAEGGAQ